MRTETEEIIFERDQAVLPATLEPALNQLARVYRAAGLNLRNARLAAKADIEHMLETDGSSRPALHQIGARFDR
ncbi:MAG: hypothetical protein O2960_02130 [Verrucomicrobia bacterium]|nr:hypothetical protein [Verrucomicrobiota bacterium]